MSAKAAALTMSIASAIQSAADPLAMVEELRAAIHAASPMHDQPVDYVRWVHIEQIEANQYNPNSVAQVEMGLLLVSIDHDGYTQPIVAIHDDERNKWVIVDGFHRYFTMKANKALYDRCHGLLPVVELHKDLNERMAATVRHNRARGKHTIQGMSSMVFKMLDGGMADEDICNALGMEVEELLRLKHITGFSKLFADREYNKSWMARSQIRVHIAQQKAD